MISWKFEFDTESIAKLEEKYLAEKWPRESLDATKNRVVALGKLPDCHAFAKEIDCKKGTAICHAIEHMCPGWAS